MKLSNTIYSTLKQKVINALQKIRHPLITGTTKISRGRKLAIKIIDILTLGLFKQQNGIETKKDLRALFDLSCSYKTLVVSLNRFALLILFLCMQLAENNRKMATKVKYTDSTDLPVCLVKNGKYHRTMATLAT